MIYPFATHIYYIDGETGFPGYKRLYRLSPPMRYALGAHDAYAVGRWFDQCYEHTQNPDFSGRIG